MSLTLLLLSISVQTFADDAAKLTINTTGTERNIDPMIEKYGMQVTSIRMSANDHMIDFRYRVLDPKKVDTLFAENAKPYMVHAASGKVLAVPRTAKVGPLMSTYQHKQDRIYWMFFGNQGKLVHAGDEVSVVIGDFRANNLFVQ